MPISPQVEVYQDTLTPVTFSLTLNFVGRTLSSDGQGSYVGFEFYLSDQDGIVPTAINGGAESKVSGAMTFDSATETVFDADLNNEQTVSVAGEVEIEIPGVDCADASRFLCAKYVIVRDLQPPFRESNTADDFACTDVSSILGCHSSRYSSNMI